MVVRDIPLYTYDEKSQLDELRWANCDAVVWILPNMQLSSTIRKLNELLPVVTAMKFVPEVPGVTYDHVDLGRLLAWDAPPDRLMGHFLRILPAGLGFYPEDPAIEAAPYSVEFPEEGVVVMRSPPSHAHELSIEYRYRVSGEAVEVTSSLCNRSPFPRTLGVWSLARVNSGELRRLEYAADGEEKFCVLPNSLKPELTRPAAGTVMLTARFRQGETFSIRVDCGAAGLKFFRAPDFTELEILRHTVSVAPRQWISLREVWTI